MKPHIDHGLPQFEAVLRLLARVSEAMTARCFATPILVDSKVVELDALNVVEIATLKSLRMKKFDAELHRYGFTKLEVMAGVMVTVYQTH